MTKAEIKKLQKGLKHASKVLPKKELKKISKTLKLAKHVADDNMAMLSQRDFLRSMDRINRSATYGIQGDSNDTPVLSDANDVDMSQYCTSAQVVTDIMDIDDYIKGKIAPIECTVTELDLDGENLIEFLCKVTDKMLVIELYAKDILNSEFKIKIITDGTHGATISVFAPGCFDSKSVLDAIKPATSECDVPLTALGPITTIVNNLIENNIVAVYAPNGKISQNDTSVGVESVEISALIIALIFSLVSLSPSDIFKITDPTTAYEIDISPVEYHTNSTKVSDEVNKKVAPKILPWVTEASARFIRAEDIDGFDKDVYLSKCEGCAFNDDECDFNCECCDHIDTCDMIDHSDADSRDEVAPGIETADDEVDDEDKLLEKTDSDEDDNTTTDTSANE